MNIFAKSALVVLLLCPAVVSAQSRSAVAIAAGPSLPIGTLRDTQNQGLALNASFIRGSDESPLGLRLNFGYDRLPGKTVGAVKNANRKIVGGPADLMFSMSGYTLKPYVVGGAGAFKMSSPSITDAKMRFGFDFGVGFTLPLASRAIFVEGRLNSISQHNAKPVRYVPIVLGILF